MNQSPVPLHVDRAVRDNLVAMLEQWIHGRVNNGQLKQFIDQLWKVQCNLPTGARDITLNEALEILDFEEIDEPSHDLADMDRDEWNSTQRLILLLKSDAILIRQQRRIWSWSCLFAGLSLLIYISLAIWFGWNNGSLILLSFPFAIVAIPLWHWRCREYARKLPEMSPDAEPFASFRQIREVRQTVSNFMKQPYLRKTPAVNLSWIDWFSRTVGNILAWWTALFVMSLFSPCLLLATCLPLSRYVSELHWPHTDEHDSPTLH